MKSRLEIPDTPRADLVPIRQAYFSREFWDMWDRMGERGRHASLLGWIAELESAIRRMQRRIDRIDEHLEELGR